MPRLKLYFPGWNPLRNNVLLFSVHLLRAQCPPLLPLVKLILITWSCWCLSSFLTVKSPFYHVIDKHLAYLCSRIVLVCLADLYSPVFLRLTTPAWRGLFLALSLGGPLVIGLMYFFTISIVLIVTVVPDLAGWDPLKVVDSYILLICSHHFWELPCYLAKQIFQGHLLLFLPLLRNQSLLQESPGSS